jgi:hypothetical protein
MGKSANKTRRRRLTRKNKRSQHKNKRSQHKRSQHKRSQHKRSQHKRSQHKRSQHKRSQHKRRHYFKKYVGGGVGATDGLPVAPAQDTSPQAVAAQVAASAQAANEASKTVGRGGGKARGSKQRGSKQRGSKQRGGSSECTSPNGCVVAPQTQNQAANSSIVDLIANQLQQNANAAGDSSGNVVSK